MNNLARRGLNLVVKATRTFGLRSLYFSRLILRAHSLTASEGLGPLDKKLIQRLSHKPGYYVELGANDGLAQSNTLILEIFHGWTGLLIEAAPHTYQRLVRTRSGRRNTLVHGACVSFDFPAKTVRLAYADLMTTPLDVETDIGDPVGHASSGLRYVQSDGNVRFVRAPAVTLTQVLQEAKSPRRISLLSLDVEGAEIEVLKGIDFSTYFFDNIIVESREPSKLEHFMNIHGYVMTESLTSLDYLFQPNGSRTDSDCSAG